MSIKRKSTRHCPPLRFPEFAGEWEECKLGEIAKGFDYGMNAAAKSFDGINKYIRITDIDESSSRYRQDDVVSPEGEQNDNYIVKENDILLARTGASTGKSYLYRNSDGKLYFAGFLIRANICRHNAYFVFSQLHTCRYWRWISIMSARSGQPGINSQEYASFSVYTTSLQEEDKIATFFRLLDERLATQSKIIDSLKSLSQAVSNKLLFGDGENIRLRDILVERIEKSTTNNEYEILSSTVKGIFSQREYFSKDIASENNVGYKIIRKHDIVLSPQNLWMGNINYNNSFEVGIVSPSYKTFTIMEKYDKVFIAHLLKTQKALFKYMLVSEQGASIVRRNLNMEAFGQLTFKIPPYNRQQKIGNIITALQNKLQAEERYKTCLCYQKQYLLRQMFI